MRMKTATLWTLLAGAMMLSPLATAQVHVSEIHYDNAGTDSGEAIEISSPAGTDLSGWQIVLYNGTNGASYDTDALTGLVPALCGDRQVVVRDYPSNGIQNGAPDAIALVDSGGTLVFWAGNDTPPHVAKPKGHVQAFAVPTDDGLISTPASQMKSMS